MKYLLVAVAGLALASCATQHQLTPARPPAPPTDEGRAYTPAMLTQRPDSSKSLSNLTSPAEKPSWLGRLFPVKQKPVPDISVGNISRKCKGCTFNVVAGNQTVAGKKAQVAAGDGAAVVVADKKAGPVVLADSGAQVQVATTKKGQAAAGKGITQQHEEVKPGPWPAIIGGVGILGGIGLLYWLVAGGGSLWLAGVFKRRKPEAQA